MALTAYEEQTESIIAHTMPGPFIHPPEDGDPGQPPISADERAKNAAMLRQIEDRYLAARAGQGSTTDQALAAIGFAALAASIWPEAFQDL